MMIQLWNVKEEDFQKAVDVIRKGEAAEEFLGNLYLGDLSIDFQLVGAPAVLNFDVYVGGLDTGYGYTEKGKRPYGYADGGCVMDSTNVEAFTSFEAFQAITAAKVLEFTGDHNWLLERANVEQISMDWVPERLMKEHPEYFSSIIYDPAPVPDNKPEVQKILEFAKKGRLSSDDLFFEAECVEEYGEWVHMSLMGYGVEDLSEAARVLREMEKEVSSNGPKQLWARVGMSFDLTGEEYQRFMDLENSPKIGDYVTSLIHEGKVRLDGDTYFPGGCNDNPAYEIGMDLSGDLFDDSKLKEQAIEIKDPISGEKHHVLCNLYYQMDNDSMVIGEAELNLKRLKGIDEESISVEIVKARDAESEDFPADKNYWMIASFQVAGEKEAIRKEIEDVMEFMSVDDIEIWPEKEMKKEIGKNIKLTPDGAIGYIEDVSNQEWYKNPDITLYDEVEQSAYELFCDFAQLIGVHLVKTEPDFYFAKEISSSIMNLLEKEFKVPFPSYGESIEMMSKPEKAIPSDDVVKNLMDAMAAYGLEAGWTDADMIDALVECGITKNDFEKYGKGDFVKDYFEEEVDSPSLSDRIEKVKAEQKKQKGAEKVAGLGDLER